MTVGAFTLTSYTVWEPLPSEITDSFTSFFYFILSLSTYSPLVTVWLTSYVFISSPLQQHMLHYKGTLCLQGWQSEALQQTLSSAYTKVVVTLGVAWSLCQDDRQIHKAAIFLTLLKLHLIQYKKKEELIHKKNCIKLRKTEMT